jgi:hypothetical protein
LDGRGNLAGANFGLNKEEVMILTIQPKELISLKIMSQLGVM